VAELFRTQLDSVEIAAACKLVVSGREHTVDSELELPSAGREASPDRPRTSRRSSR